MGALFSLFYIFYVFVVVSVEVEMPEFLTIDSYSICAMPSPWPLETIVSAID